MLLYSEIVGYTLIIKIVLALKNIELQFIYLFDIVIFGSFEK